MHTGCLCLLSVDQRRSKNFWAFDQTARGGERHRQPVSSEQPDFKMQINSFRGEIEKSLTLKGHIILACLSELRNDKKICGGNCGKYPLRISENESCIIDEKSSKKVSEYY